MLSKKAQIGETMTWVVATIIIIFILAISIFFVKFNFEKRDFVYSVSNDLIVSKSTTSFLKEDNNFENLKTSIENNNYEKIKPKIEKFLQEISLNGEYDFGVFVDDKLQQGSIVSNTPSVNAVDSYLQFNLNGKNIGLSIYGGRDE